MRNHPARAMYDQIEDALTSLTMQLRSAITADAQARPLGGRARGWARQISSELASVLLDTLGLAGTIEWHVRQYQKCTGILCELTVSSAARFDLPEDYAATIFDMYNEALSNVARHAGASRVAISLTVTPHEVTLAVSDDGIGLPSEAPASDAGGIAAIRERSRAHAGFCEFAGTRNAGTTVTVSLPIAAVA
jgi:two-component system sensor histidine kinase UhpB